VPANLTELDLASCVREYGPGVVVLAALVAGRNPFLIVDESAMIR
jgi:hypothetical protein